MVWKPVQNCCFWMRIPLPLTCGTGYLYAAGYRRKRAITPFLNGPDLYGECGISTILVAGSSGAFFHIADTIIQMDSYQVLDITKKVKDLCADYPLPPASVPVFSMPDFKRVMTAPAVKRDSYKELKLKTHGRDSFSIGKETVDLRYIEQLADSEQIAALAQLLKYAREHLIDNKKTVSIMVRLWRTNWRKKAPGAVFLYPLRTGHAQTAGNLLLL
ncbi:MAG: P-loop domain-containing protein [Blautia faecis]